MNALETALAETAQWAIVDTLYFDSVTHSFIRADIEIDGARIAAVLPPATSKRMTRLAGETAVCLPGLIDPDVGSNCEDWSACLQSLAMRGVTTAGTFCRNDFDCRRVAGAEGIRRLCYVELGAHDPPDESIDANQEEWQRFERAIGAMTSSRCELLPAVVPEKIGSAAALLAAAKLAHELRRRLCIRLCSTAPDAQRYKETRFFTELGLLSYLSLLTNATIFDLSQISRTDTFILNGSPADVVCSPGTVNEWLMQRRYAPLSLANRAIGFASNGNVLAGADQYASLVSLSMALKKSNSEVEVANLVADALTRSAAMALGIEGLGTIAANMKADLCVFDRPFYLREECNSLDFLKLLASGRPRHVLVDGTPVVVEGAFVHADEMVEG